jgi:hypothetical protein
VLLFNEANFSRNINKRIDSNKQIEGLREGERAK